ncbi:intracellular protein transport protein USO1-like [Asbolus verrucosus]|uniref:Intracellular protein transport protein USO1-like n=1 Tax=Asbolus verrucosus TaxID=1661398 RepID=A0A482VQB0_ASBVE|nr:intracellular protein transport protein USO1-like [Asbolus verrucosus]
MPAGKDGEAGASNPAQRTTFRPPWVKDGPNPLPVPTAPWTLKNTRRDSNKEAASENPLAGVQLRKTSITAKDPQENGKDNTFKRPQLRPVPPKEETKPPKETLPPVKLNSVAERQKNEAAKKPPIQRMPSKDEEIDRVTPVTRNALVREESMRRLSQTPAPPPMPPPAPAMPGSNKMKPLTQKQKERIEQLKNRPKVRPDWTAMLKEIEGNKKLKHVECNDRSQPLLPQTKATEHFVFESEKANVHNELLKQIQSGTFLKKVKTNDRSKPMLEGLRKFRRQMTIEEQIQKSVSMASMPPEEIEDEADEMDDIDKVRDDLQSTKQMLALELRNKEAQIRENKRLMARIQNLEAELDKERHKEKSSGNGKSNEVDDKLINSLKKETEQARKTSEEVEKKYMEVTEQLDNTKFQLEEQKKQNQLLEKKLQEALQGKRTSISKDNMVNGEESEEEIMDNESSDESDGEDTEEKRERRVQRELKQLRNKLRNFKNKEDNAKKERVALREIMKKHQVAIKEEKKKYKVLQKEVDKMAALMKDVSDDEEEEDEEKEESEEEVEEEEESSEESETEESEDDSDSERSQSEPEDAPVEKKRANLTARSSRHEKILAALKKGNFMLKTNAERLQDDLNKQKEMTASLQEDLDSVLAELG